MAFWMDQSGKETAWSCSWSSWKRDAEGHGVHVVRNGYFGDERKFELYNDSGAAQVGRGSRRLLGDASRSGQDRVADDIFTRSALTPSDAAKVLPIGNRAELGRWRSEARKVLARVLS